MKKDVVYNIALFVDIENFIISSSEIGVPVDLQPVTQRLRELGRISILRAFGDVQKCCKCSEESVRIRRMLVENQIQIEDIPYITNHKNTADIRLAVEATATAFTNTHIDAFAILSSDRDYQPLIAKLRELGRYTIGIGCSADTVNTAYVRAFDYFIYYSSLFNNSAHRTISDSDFGVDRVRYDSYIKLICKAASLLEQSGRKPVGAELAPLMRQLCPDFDLAVTGMRSLRELATEAEKQGLCRIEASGGDFAVTITDDDSSQPSVANQENEDPRPAYAQYFRAKLSCDIPKIMFRKIVYQLCQEYLNSPQNYGETTLRGLTGIVLSGIRPAASPEQQHQAFKLLYGLFRAGVFESETSIQPFNPKIIRIRVMDDWDDKFIRNCLKVMQIDHPEWPLVIDELADLFEVGPAQVAEIVSRLPNSSPSWQ